MEIAEILPLPSRFEIRNGMVCHRLRPTHTESGAHGWMGSLHLLPGKVGASLATSVSFNMCRQENGNVRSKLGKGKGKTNVAMTQRRSRVLRKVQRTLEKDVTKPLQSLQ